MSVPQKPELPAGGIVLHRPPDIPEAVMEACPLEWRFLLGHEVNVSFAPGISYKGQCVAITKEWIQVKLMSPQTRELLRVTILWARVIAIEQPWGHVG